MAFNPLEEKGVPLEKQFKNCDELNTKPYDKEKVRPYIGYQDQVNANGSPSETVVDTLIRKTGNDYRYEIIGPHPVNMYRRQEAVSAVRKRLPE